LITITGYKACGLGWWVAKYYLNFNFTLACPAGSSSISSSGYQEVADWYVPVAKVLAFNKLTTDPQA
jgi:hypothetical protein